MNILIVPDKFKGTLTAHAAAEAIAKGWRKGRPGDSLRLLPMSDGGDGFGEILGARLNARVQTVKTIDAAHRPRVAKWWWVAASKTAIIESAAVNGLAMLQPGQFHPFELDTFGLGAVIAAATDKGARHGLMGIGGSATNDGGFGLARSLGWKFRDRSGAEIRHWTGLDQLTSIRAPRRRKQFTELNVAVDVQNVLLGARGATRVYGPQKGLHPEDFTRAERCLRRLAQVVKTDVGVDSARQPGSGAAGGLGFGLTAFLGARLENGFELFARQANLEDHLRWADLVITGEGAIDPSTLMGKGVGQIAERCRRLAIPCIGLAGAVTAPDPQRLFSQTFALTSKTNIHEAKANSAFWLEQVATHAGKTWDDASRIEK